MASEGLNRVSLIGNLGAAPELRHTQGGEPVLNIRIATTEKWYDRQSQAQKEHTEWHNVVLWGKRGEALARILDKGSTIYVDGSLRSSTYEKNGQTHYKTEIKARELILLGGGAPRQQQNSRPSPQRQQQPQQQGGGYAPTGYHAPPQQQQQGGGYAPQGGGFA